MTLKQYLALTEMRPAEFARLAGLSPSSIYRFLDQSWGLSDENKLKIEYATGGLVSAGDLVRRNTGGNPPSVGASSGAVAHPNLSTAASDGTPNSNTGE